jgi:hypothetical protein
MNTPPLVPTIEVARSASRRRWRFFLALLCGVFLHQCIGPKAEAGFTPSSQGLGTSQTIVANPISEYHFANLLSSTYRGLVEGQPSTTLQRTLPSGMGNSGGVAGAQSGQGSPILNSLHTISDPPFVTWTRASLVNVVLDDPLKAGVFRPPKAT